MIVTARSAAPGTGLGAHRSAGARVDWVPEPLERGLPGGAENIADLPPAMTGRARPVDGLLHRLAGGGGQVPRRLPGLERGTVADGGRARQRAGPPCQDCHDDRLVSIFAFTSGRRAASRRRRAALRQVTSQYRRRLPFPC